MTDQEWNSLPNEVIYTQLNWLECQRDPDITPKWGYVIFYSNESGYAMQYHLATFSNENQLKEFAKKLGFSYTWTKERDDGFKEGRCSCIIEEDSVDNDVDGDWEHVNYVYGISPENLKKATKFKALSNGSIVDCYYVNDGNRIRVFRCNPNYPEFYNPLPLAEHIAFQKENGTY